ncbi:MAG: ribosomal protein S12 methylthiotransferase RimO [Omnitrophica bacterium GWA2_52_8]|nr:MAG: ribosomal protein S12 methylthiotransferase RimO [Omnitrophica bacterium GWA2_52_8]
MRIGMLSLGCPKTLVDSETILGKLDPGVFRITNSVADCDIALLNTCAFIQEAQQESVDRILELVELKKQNQIRSIIVMGCLVQRFPQELQKELKAVDAFVGSGEYDKVSQIVSQVADGGHVFSVGRPGYLATAAEGRVALTPEFYRYLKISEGCDHVCSFCTIPLFRGKHRSRPMPDILEEARLLVKAGAKELVVTGQDTTYYGRDLYGRYELPVLLKELDKIEGLHWIRLLYAYPSCITEDLIAAIRDGEKICRYLDMPLQHASDPMLQAMRRGITKRKTIDLIKRFRAEVPDLAIRTTFIVGFPGETDGDFEELMEFMESMRFERLGIFTYSREKDSAAALLPNQVEESVKQERFEKAMLLQQRISGDNNQGYLGKTLDVLIEKADEHNPGCRVGRSYMDAPEVDGSVYVRSSKKFKPGTFCRVSITETREYDLVGEPV